VTWNFSRILSIVRIVFIVMGVTCALTVPSDSSPKVDQKQSRAKTYLALNGKFDERVFPFMLDQWRRSSLAHTEKGALAAVWLGEWELGRCEQPYDALKQFQLAQKRVIPGSRVWTLAMVDRSITLTRQGRNAEALTSLQAIDNRRSLDRYTHARVRELELAARMRKAFKDRNIAEGIPEPSDKLDPFCAEKSLSACLKQKFHYTFDLRKACRVTGLGSNLADLKVACDRLGVRAYLVKANLVGFKSLPKPLVAFVDHDHFVAVLDSNRDGLNVYCSECPGGSKRYITWKQWEALEASAYLVPIRGIPVHRQPVLSDLLRSAVAFYHPRHARRRRFAAKVNALAHEIGLLNERAASYFSCGPLQLPGLPGDNGPVAYHGDPIDLAHLTDSVSPELDLAVHNPIGPSVAWGRRYNSILSAFDSSEVYDAQDLFNFGQNWTTSYSDFVVDSTPFVVPQAPEGVSTQIGSQGPGTLDAGYTWELYLNGSKVQDNTNPGGWTVSLPGPEVLITPPTTLSSTLGYKIVWTWNYSTYSAQFDALPAETVRQGMQADFSPNGSDAPSTGLSWDIVRAGTTVASSSSPNSWSVIFSYPSIVVTAPISAALASNYEVRMQVSTNSPPYYVDISTTFTVAVGHAILGAGTKYALLDDRSESAFTAPSVPSSTNTSVLCTSAPGTRFVAYWLYDPNNLYGDYKLEFANGASLLLVGIAQLDGSAAIYIPVKQYDQFGNYINLNYTGPGTYNGMPTLSSITRSDGGLLLSINRNSANGITSVSDCYSRSVYYGFSSYGLLDSVSEPVVTGSSNPPTLESYSYDGGDSSLNGITKMSPTGSGSTTTTFNLDPHGESVESTVDGEGNQCVYAHTTDGVHTKVTIENSSGTVLQSFIAGFTSTGLISSLTDGSGTTVIYSASYADSNDPFLPSTVKDGDSRVWSYSYDTYGHTLTATSPRNVTTTYTYSYANNPFGELTQVQTGSLPATTFAYYEPLHLLKTASGTLASGTTGSSTLTYSALGNVLTVTRPGNATSSSIVTTFGYTSDGSYNQSEELDEPLTVTDNLGHVSHSRYDALGRVSSSWDALGNTIGFAYNLADQPTQLTYPASGQTGSGQGYTLNTYLWTGGPQSNVSVFDESNRLVRSVTSTYGQTQELLSSTGTSDSITYGYDAAYRLTSVKNGNSGTTTYSYNTAGYPYQTVFPGGDTTTCNSYSNSGRVLQATTPAGIVKNLTYSDPEGFLTAVSYPAYPSQNLSFSYDGYGRPNTFANGNESIVYSWGTANQLLERIITLTGLSAQDLNYSYNPDGSLKALDTSAGYFNYGYDGAERLTSVSNPSLETTSYTYLNNNWLSKRTLSNGAYTTYTSNALGQASAVTNYSPSNAVLSQFGSLVHDGAGNLTSLSATVAGSASLTGTAAFTYDGYGQLKSDASTRDGSYSNSFSYDGDGNATVLRGVATAYTSKDEVNETGYAFTADGVPSEWNSATAGSDAENRVTGFSGYNSILYGVDGSRTSKTVSGTTTNYIYEGGVPILELNSSGTVTAINTFGRDGLISRHSSGASDFYQFDQSGATTERLNSSGAVLDAHGADAFGKPIATPTTSDPYDGFGAQYGYCTDHETGLELVGKRFYDPKGARFLNRDPQGYGGGFNQFRYCGNSPLSHSDPAGEETAGQVADQMDAYVNGQCANIARAYGTDTLLGRCLTGAGQGSLRVLPGILGGPMRTGTGIGHYYGHPAAKNLGPAILDGVGIGLDLIPGAVEGVGPAEAGLGALEGLGELGGEEALVPSTADRLTGIASDAIDAMGEGSGPVYGTRVHTQFANAIKALDDPNLNTEVSYLNGVVVDHGTPGSIRCDVVEGPTDTPTAIYDLKTGSATLTQARIAQILAHLPKEYQGIPVIQIKP
jgi:RHS repeat-associated protein